eukprot:6802821-Alexandrium_andersonii.AAC.1
MQAANLASSCSTPSLARTPPAFGVRGHACSLLSASSSEPGWQNTWQCQGLYTHTALIHPDRPPLLSQRDFVGHAG